MRLSEFCAKSVRGYALTCKKNTGAIIGHDHFMKVSAQLVRNNAGLRVRVNRKFVTTAADDNKQGDVQAMEFGILGYDNLAWDFLSSVIASSVIGRSMASIVTATR